MAVLIKLRYEWATRSDIPPYLQSHRTPACESDFDQVQRVQDECGQRPSGDPADQVLVPDPRQEVRGREEGEGIPTATSDEGGTVTSVHGDTVPVQIEQREYSCNSSQQITRASHFISYCAI